MNNPYYFIRLDCYGCSYKVLINDFPVTIQNGGNGMTTSFPINPLIRSGENTIKIIMLPHPEIKTALTVSSTCEAQISEALEDDLENRKEIAVFKNPLFSSDDNERPLPLYYEVQGVFKASVPFKDHQFFNSRPFAAKSADLNNKLHQQYMKLWESFQEKRIDYLLQNSAIKEEELTSSLYLSKYERLSYVQKCYKKYFDELELFKLHFQYYKVTFYANKSIVCLEDELGDQPLVFVNRQEGSSTYIPLYFIQDEAGRLFIAR